MITDEDYTTLMETRALVASNPNWGTYAFEKDFIKAMSLLNPQSYGARIEKRIMHDVEAQKVKASEGKGDIKLNGKNIEVKISLLTPVNHSLNMVQIRLFHEVDFYLCIGYDIRDIKDYKKYVFLLTHDQMEKECERAHAAHGTKSVNEINKNVELRLQVDCVEGNAIFERWKDLYEIDLPELATYV